MTEKLEFSACDMATAAAEGFRDGVASVRSVPPAAAVVMPEPLKRSEEGMGVYGAALIRGYNACLREVARLNPAPAEQSAMVVPEGWLIEIGFSVLDKPFRFVDSKSHTPTITVILPACEVDDSVAWDLRDEVARRIGSLLAAPTPAPVSQWISVEDRLPEPFTVVALMHDDRWMNAGAGDFQANWTAAGWLDDSFGRPHWSVIGEMRAQCLDAATHWMPLPPAPEQPAKEQGK